MKNVFFLFFVLSLFVLGTGCSASEQTSSALPTVAANEDLTAGAVISAFEKAGLPVFDKKVFDDNTDPNKLLNRPGQYIEKINFSYRQLPQNEPDTLNSTIEVFKSKEDMNKRKEYVDTVTKSISALSEYSYAHKNVLLRLSHDLTPTEAKKYEDTLKSL